MKNMETWYWTVTDFVEEWPKCRAHRITTKWLQREWWTRVRRILRTSHIGSRGAFANFRFWIRFFDGLFVDAKTSHFRARSPFEGFCTLPAFMLSCFITCELARRIERVARAQGYTRTNLDKTPCKDGLILKTGLMTKHTSNAARIQVVIWAYFQKDF